MTNSELALLLHTLRQELARLLGEQLDRVLLFGSRVRGEARPDSDIDVLVVMRGDVNPFECLRRTSDVIAKLSLQHDVVISPVFMSREQFEHGGSPFVLNVRREALAV
jgi:predicted nucleotidyltransferase